MKTIHPFKLEALTTVILLAFTSAFLGFSRNVAPPKVVEMTGMAS